VARLRLKEVSEAHGLNMSQLQRQSGLTMGVVRRYWYNTANGLAEGEPLEMISLQHINRLAEVLDVQPGELVAPETEESTPGITIPGLVAA
jgi:transcriptional regulator with XRE-family HTH domain